MTVTIPRIETERLVLRAPGPEDFPAYRDFFADGDASHFYGGPLRPDRAWRRLAQDVGHWHLRGYGLWIVEERSSGIVCGGCGLFHTDGWPRRELTWWLLPPARGKGYATEASRAAIIFALDHAGWEQVETHMDDRNEAARRLALRLGGTAIAREAFPDGKDRTVYRLPRPSDNEFGLKIAANPV
ncbi:MAG: GNAT family N-acetyltransferase [Pseudomonadota bacterium]